MKRSPLSIAALAALLVLPWGCQETPEKTDTSAQQPPPFLQNKTTAPPAGDTTAAAPNMAGGGPTGAPSGSGSSQSGGLGGETGPGATNSQPPIAPFASGSAPLTSEEALKHVATMDSSLMVLQTAMEKAQADYKKKPGDPTLKAAYVDATYKFGHAVMEDQGKIPPRIQYRAALALYRRALAVDPKHKPSLDDKALIETIYKQMGMPVPE